MQQLELAAPLLKLEIVWFGIWFNMWSDSVEPSLSGIYEGEEEEEEEEKENNIIREARWPVFSLAI